MKRTSHGADWLVASAWQDSVRGPGRGVVRCNPLRILRARVYFLARGLGRTHAHRRASTDPSHHHGRGRRPLNTGWVYPARTASPPRTDVARTRADRGSPRCWAEPRARMTPLQLARARASPPDGRSRAMVAAIKHAGGCRKGHHEGIEPREQCVGEPDGSGRAFSPRRGDHR